MGLRATETSSTEVTLFGSETFMRDHQTGVDSGDMGYQEVPIPGGVTVPNPLATNGIASSSVLAVSNTADSDTGSW